MLSVVHMSNKDNTGKTVLNDEKLLEILRLYPFLICKSHIAYNDVDYNEWGWQQVAQSFNASYGSCYFDKPYTPKMLSDRWSQLEQMSKKHGYIREFIFKIEQTQRSDSSTKPLTDAQRMILNSIGMVEQMPMSTRLQLEEDMMKLIFKYELDSKAALTEQQISMEKVEQECREFLQIIKLNDDGVADEDDEVEQGKDDINKPSTSSKSTHINIASKRTLLASSDESSDSEFKTATNELLVPLRRPRFVPLARAHYYVRECRVRVKRCKIPRIKRNDFSSDDDEPLSILGA